MLATGCIFEVEKVREITSLEIIKAQRIGVAFAERTGFAGPKYISWQQHYFNQRNQANAGKYQEYAVRIVREKYSDLWIVKDKACLIKQNIGFTIKN